MQKIETTQVEEVVEEECVEVLEILNTFTTEDYELQLKMG